jgi:Uma2 family endonuclease
MSSSTDVPEPAVPTGLEVVEEDNWLWEPGEIKVVVIGPSGGEPAIATGNIVFSLHMHKKRYGGGRVFMSRLTYLVDLPHRQAICPDVSWYTGSTAGVGYPRGAPVFAVEVRDWIDHGDEAERRMAAKRADYFAAGTLVIWDVDVLREKVIRAYRADDPGHATVYRQGETADAEPAVPGWRFPVDELFD